MNYKNFIQRRLGELVNYKSKTSSYSFFGMSDGKKREIIVFLRNQTDMDKQQLMEFAQERFNVNEYDSEKLFYEAFPDGIDIKEANILNELNRSLKEAKLPDSYMANAFNAAASKNDFASEIDPIIDGNVRLIISTLCHRRDII